MTAEVSVQKAYVAAIQNGVRVVTQKAYVPIIKSEVRVSLQTAYVPIYALPVTGGRRRMAGFVN